MRRLRFLPFLFVFLLFANLAHARSVLVPTTPQGVFELKAQDVRVEIDDFAALTHVKQRFYNPGSRPLEAVYYFAIPPNSTVTDFAIMINGERVRGEVLRRDEARQTYEAIVRRMVDPGLLEYSDSELFKASIFPVPARGEQTVEISYATTLTQTNGALHYRLPVHEGSLKDSPAFTVSGEIRSAQPISNIWSPNAFMETTRVSASRARFALESSSPEQLRNLEVFVARSTDEVGLSLLTWDGEGDDKGYFMLTLSPTDALQNLEVLPKQVTFVLDTSGSMHGSKWTQAVASLRYAVDALHERDTFNIVAFSSTARTAFRESVPASRQNKDQARAFVDDLLPRGGTNIEEALALALRQRDEAGRPHSVVFLTDGEPTEGVTGIPELLQQVASGFESDTRRLFVVGVGYSLNTRLLDGMATRGRGQVSYVRPNEPLDDRIKSLVDRLANPLLTNIQIDFGRASISDVYPTQIPDLYRGETITIFGRYARSERVTVRVRGFAGRERWQNSTELRFGGESALSFIGNLWASRRVADLLQNIAENGETPERVREVEELAIRWSIVTPYTSYLATDPSEGRVPDMGIPRPIPMPRPMPGPMPVTRSRGEAADFAGGSPAAAMRAEAAPATSGRAAVEASMERQSLATQDSVSVASAVAQQRIGNRTFEVVEGVWTQRDLRAGTPVRVEYMGAEWMRLSRHSDELRRVLMLGERVRFEHGGRVYEVSP